MTALNAILEPEPDDWIRCDERLPDTSDPVLVWSNNVWSNGAEDCLDLAWYMNNEWVLATGGFVATGVTHWKPIRPPRK